MLAQYLVSIGPTKLQKLEKNVSRLSIHLRLTRKGKFVSICQWKASASFPELRFKTKLCSYFSTKFQARVLIKNKSAMKIRRGFTI